MVLVIPTRRREKLPSDFAYTFWPSKVTVLLAETPQRNDAELVYSWRDELWESHWRKRIQQHGTIKLIEAVYTTSWSPYFPKWKIIVFSVPKEYLTAAQEILFDGAMEEFAKKLNAHGLTPTDAVQESITMDLNTWEHDETHLNPEQFSQ